MKNVPNLFIVGAAKAGTTSLHNYLNKHHNIFMSPIKEPHYFSKDIRCDNFDDYYRKHSCYDIKDYLQKSPLKLKHSAYNIEKIEDYLQLFREVKEEQYIGEASVGYLYSEKAAEEISMFNQDAKVVIVLRHPVERAFSHWLMDLKGNDVCRTSFLDAISKDQQIENKGWGKSHLYIELGLYYKQVKRYLDVFPREQVSVLFYDDFKNDQESFINKIFNFLCIDSIKIDFSIKKNTSNLPRLPWLNRTLELVGLKDFIKLYLPSKFIKKLKKISNKSQIPSLSKADRNTLNKYFENDIILLESLLKVDLSHWKH